MPAIDLARLRKQANRLADFFFLPDEFMKHLREMLDFYVNYTLRTKENIAPGSNLKTYRTPPVVLRHIENELREVAAANAQNATELADMLWDEGALETRLLAAYLLSRIPPLAEHLLPRISVWTQQIRDPEVRSALLTTSLTRMRKEAPREFLALIREWLHPARTRTWSNGIQALLPMIADTSFENFPPILDVVEPIVQAAPSTLQVDLKELIIELYKASPSETTFFLKQILTTSEDQMTSITMRRISASFPTALQIELKDYLRISLISQVVRTELEESVPEIPTMDVTASESSEAPLGSQREAKTPAKRETAGRTEPAPKRKNDSRKPDSSKRKVVKKS